MIFDIKGQRSKEKEKRKEEENEMMSTSKLHQDPFSVSPHSFVVGVFYISSLFVLSSVILKRKKRKRKEHMFKTNTQKKRSLSGELITNIGHHNCLSPF
jgi:hypothetical protein